MASVWPWLAVAGVGALHGLNPASGWVLAAGCGLRASHRSQPLRALMPIALGHVASIALVATTVALGLSRGPALLQVLAGALLVAGLVVHLRRRRVPVPMARHVGLALSSFVVSSAHGAGLMLVPALVPICIGNGPARELTASGSLALALAAVGVHTAAVLAVTGIMASTFIRLLDALCPQRSRFRPMRRRLGLSPGAWVLPLDRRSPCIDRSISPAKASSSPAAMPASASAWRVAC